MSDTDLRSLDLARFYLKEQACFVKPRLPLAHLEKLIAAMGDGADHVEGEEIVALIAHRSDADEGAFWTMLQLLNPIRFVVQKAVSSNSLDFWHGAILTDRRLMVRDDSRVVILPYDQIAGVRTSGSAAAFVGWTYLDLTLVDGTEPFVYAPGRKILHRYIQAHIDLREGGGTLVPSTRGPLPSGPEESRLELGDPRARALLDLLSGKEDSRDLVRRVVLWSRNTINGRGMHEGMWLSSLRPSALLALCAAALGEPIEQPGEVEGGEAWRFQREKDVARAAGLTALNLLAGNLGVVLPKGDVRLSMIEGDGFTRYRLEHQKLGKWGPLGETAHPLIMKLHTRFLEAEGRVLLRRCLGELAATDEECMEEIDDDLSARLRASLPEADPTWFKHVRTREQLYPKRSTLPLDGPLRPPPGLPRAVVLKPSTIQSIAVLHLLAGLAQLTIMPMLSCCGLAGLWWLPLRYVMQAVGIDIDTTTMVTSVGSIGTFLMFFPHGVAEIIAGIVFLNAPLKGRLPIQIWSGLGILSFCLMGFLPALVGLMSLGLIRTKAMKDFYEAQA